MVTWGDDGATVLVASTWVNVANFVLFDIVLISILFFVTTDIAGRFNHKDIYSGDPLFQTLPSAESLSSIQSKEMLLL